MSGGSFNYLCYTENLGLAQEELEAMAEELRDLGYGGLAELTLSYINPTPSQALREVWKAVEWWRSGDIGKDQAIRLIEENRVTT